MTSPSQGILHAASGDCAPAPTVRRPSCVIMAQGVAGAPWQDGPPPGRLHGGDDALSP